MQLHTFTALQIEINNPGACAGEWHQGALLHNTGIAPNILLVGSCSGANYLKRNSAMDDSIGGS